MEKEEFFIKLKEKASEININLDDEQLEKFYLYMNLLIEWNEKINLTAITEPNDIILKHFIDSLTILTEIKPNSTVVDVGTGAGFPGIPLKIANNSLKITLVDSLNKRINFLNDVIDKLQLKNIETIHARAEEIGKNKKFRENFDIATSRAVANISTLSEYLVPLVKQGGNIIIMKASDADEEIESGKNAIKVLGGKIKNIEKFNLPQTDIGRTIINVEKKLKTPSQYPRKAGLPAKQPL